MRALVESGTVPVTFAPVRAERPVPTPTKEPEVVAPVTPRDVRVPTDVMFGWAFPETLIETLEVAIAPEMLEAKMPYNPTPFPYRFVALTKPPTVNPVKVPTEVIDG